MEEQLAPPGQSNDKITNSVAGADLRVAVDATATKVEYESPNDHRYISKLAVCSIFFSTSITGLMLMLPLISSFLNKHVAIDGAIASYGFLTILVVGQFEISEISLGSFSGPWTI